MTIVAADLITAFPEFGSAVTYPAATINFWIAQAVNQVSATAFPVQANYDYASLLFVAHNVSLAARAATGAARNAPGEVAGPYSSKSVGGVSKSMDVGAVTNAGAGFWNTTSYGVRYYQMIKAGAAGPRYYPGYVAPTYPYFPRLPY